MSKVFLKPHTDLWFDVMERINFATAMHTRRVVANADTPDCCSVCGDEDVPAYEIDGQMMAANAPLTMRLCDDCRGIRMRQLGEHYRLIDEKDLAH